MSDCLVYVVYNVLLANEGLHCGHLGDTTFVQQYVTLYVKCNLGFEFSLTKFKFHTLHVQQKLAKRSILP